MKKLLLTSCILATSLFGYSYNDLLLKAQSNIFPKILLLDKKLGEKLVNGKVVYTIACEENDFHTAMQIRDLMVENYHNSLGNYKLLVEVKRYSELDAETETSAVYALNSTEGVGKISRLATKSGFMTFAYDIGNLRHGLLLSLMVEKTTVLYLNRQGLQSHNVDFVESLYQIVKFSNN